MPEMSAADAAGSTCRPACSGRRAVIGTNNQEQGVDEADQVKTDGRRLVSLVNGTLRVVAARRDSGDRRHHRPDGPRRHRSVPPRRHRAGARHHLRGANYGGAPYDSAPAGSGTLRPAPAVPSTTPHPCRRPPSRSRRRPTTTAPTATTTTAPTTTVPPTSVAPTTALTTTTTAPTTTVLPVPPPFAVATTITIVSLADPASPAVTASADLGGHVGHRPGAGGPRPGRRAGNTRSGCRAAVDVDIG